MMSTTVALAQRSQETDWSAWIGRTETTRERIAPERIAALAASLDLAHAPGPTDGVPPGWHWIYFNPVVRRSSLGSDGHPKRGGFLPPVPLPRRMWAGGRIHYSTPILIGTDAERVSEILKVENKSGKGGQLVFVTVRHTISAQGATCLVEEQDIVYREAPPEGQVSARFEPAPGDAVVAEQVVPDPVLLFRYSALTSNGHRIHYDRPYATAEEGYRDLVVHGPLLATLLQGLAARQQPARRLREFSFRGVAPVFVDRSFHLEAGQVDAAGRQPLWIRGPDDELCMRASADFA